MLEEHGIIKKYGNGEMIFTEGDPGHEMYIVRDGAVKIFRNREGREVKLTTLGEGEFFGEIALFLDRPRSASAQAVGDTFVEVVDKNTFASYMKEPLVMEVLVKLSERICEIDDKVEALSVSDQVRKEHLNTLVTQSRWVL